MEAMALINHKAVDPKDIPYKIQPGRASYELVASLTAVTEYIGSLASKSPKKVAEVTREDIAKGTAQLS